VLDLVEDSAGENFKMFAVLFLSGLQEGFLEIGNLVTIRLNASLGVFDGDLNLPDLALFFMEAI
jgi:hypothetical protein